MLFSVAGKETAPFKIPQVLEIKAALAVRIHNVKIEIYKVGIIAAVPLGVAYPMRIVASIAGSIFSTNVFVMLAEGLVIQNRIPVMA